MAMVCLMMKSIWNVGDGSTILLTLINCKYRRARQLISNFRLRMSNDSYYYIEMYKLLEANGMYDDGIYYFFGDAKPQHVRVKLQTDNPDIETCDVRLTSLNVSTGIISNFTKVEWHDVFFYRFGYFNYQKLNLIDMVKKFYEY